MYIISFVLILLLAYYCFLISGVLSTSKWLCKCYFNLNLFSIESISFGCSFVSILIFFVFGSVPFVIDVRSQLASISSSIFLKPASSGSPRTGLIGRSTVILVQSHQNSQTNHVHFLIENCLDIANIYQYQWGKNLPVFRKFSVLLFLH